MYCEGVFEKSLEILNRNKNKSNQSPRADMDSQAAGIFSWPAVSARKVSGIESIPLRHG